MHECALLSGLERVHDEWSQSAQRRSPCHSSPDHCRAAPPPLRHDAESLHGFIAQREELLRSRFELGTGPGLVRAEFALASRGADGRRREPVQGRATTSRRKGNLRNVVAPQSAGLQLLISVTAVSANAMPNLKERAKDDGPVDWSALRGSPAKAMQDTLAWVRQEYGAVDAFLEGADADEAWRRTLLSRNSR